MPPPPEPPPAFDHSCGLIRSSYGPSVRLMNAAATLCWPALTRIGSVKSGVAPLPSAAICGPFSYCEQRHALAVDRDVDVLEARVVAVGERHLERVLAVGGEHVIDDHAAARAVRRALDVVPRVLRHVGLVGVGLVDRRRVLVAHRHAADVAGGVEVRLEQRRRQRLLVGDVVEVRAHRVLRQPVRRHSTSMLEQVLDRARVLGAIQALERAAAGIRIGLRVRVNRRLERADEALIGRRRRDAACPAAASCSPAACGSSARQRRLPRRPSRCRTTRARDCRRDPCCDRCGSRRSNS